MDEEKGRLKAMTTTIPKWRKSFNQAKVGSNPVSNKQKQMIDAKILWTSRSHSKGREDIV